MIERIKAIITNAVTVWSVTAFAVTSPFYAAFTQSSPATVTKPPVKSLTQKGYIYRYGKIRLSQQVTSEYTDDNKMNKIVVYSVDTLGIATKAKQTLFKYDKNKRLLLTTQFNTDNTLVYKEEYFYDAEGNRVRAEFTDYTITPKGETYHSTYQYNFNNMLVKVESFNAQNLQVKEKAWDYNNDGDVENAYSWELMSSEGPEEPVRHKTSTHNEYDNQGNLLTSTWEITDGKNTLKEVRTFQNNYMSEWVKYKNGRMVSHFSKEALFGMQNATRNNLPDLEPPIPYQDDLMPVNQGREQWFSHFEFDSNGNPTLTETVVDGSVVSSYKFEYDDEGNMVRTLRFFKDRPDDHEEIKAEYDRYKNKISELLARNGKSISKMEYLYEYY